MPLPSMCMGWLDIVLLLPLAWGLIRGLVKGFVVSIGSLIGLIVGIYVANAKATEVGAWLSQWFTLSERQLYALSYVLLFIGITLLCMLLSRLVAKFFSALSMAWLDKLLGAILGFLKYALIMSVLVNLVETVDVRLQFIEPETKVNSLAYFPLQRLAPGLLPFVHFYLDEYNHETTETE